MTVDDRLRTVRRPPAVVWTCKRVRARPLARGRVSALVARCLLSSAVAEGASLPATARGNGTPSCGGWVRRARGSGLSEEAVPALRPCLAGAGGRRP